MKLKRFFPATLIRSMLPGRSCRKKVDTAREKEAIKSIIEHETRNYIAKNYEDHAKSFVQDESLIILVARKSGFGYVEGWKALSTGNKSHFEENPTPDPMTFTNENYKIKVYDNAAMAVYDEMVFDEAGEFLKKVINVRFLEKIDGEWKINYLGDVTTSSYEVD